MAYPMNEIGMWIKTVDLLGDVEELFIPYMTWKEMEDMGCLREDIYIPQFGESGFSPLDFADSGLYQSVETRVVTASEMYR